MDLYGKGKLGLESWKWDPTSRSKEKGSVCTSVPRSLPKKTMFSLSLIERPMLLQHGGVK